MVERGTLRFGVTHNAGDIERRLGLAPRGLTRAMQIGTQRAGLHLVAALERMDETDGQWSPTTLFSPTGATFTATATEDVQAYREFGTRPHPIVAKTKKALRFFWAKRRGVVYRRSVQHPGQRANPYVKRAGEFAERAMTSEFERAVDEELR